jgi:hypothetical protein
MLSVPVLGMAIAVALILYKRPANMVVALGVILFVAVQYLLMMFFWFKRLEGLLSKRKQLDDHEEKQHIDQEAIHTIDSSEILLPEEERVFPTTDEQCQ